MLRILALISISGRKNALSPLAANLVIPNGELEQMGLLRRHPPPPIDSWVYSSPCYQFHREELDEELRDFLNKHHLLGAYKLNEKEGIDYPLFTISPVDQSHEDMFSCLLSNEILSLLSKLGLSLEIAPAVIMPEKPFWTDHA